MRAKTSASAGFTIIELLVVIIMIGVISAIAAPGWLSFVTRQRLNAARGEVLQIMTKAQTDAEQQSLTRTIGLVTTPGAPALTVSAPSSTSLEQKIGDGKSALKVEAFVNNVQATSIAFNHKGQVVPNSDPTVAVVPFVIKVSAVDGGVPPRCVVVTTLLGSMVMAEGDDCDASFDP